MKLQTRPVFLVIMFLCWQSVWAQKASISEEMVSFKTYPYADPDPVAQPTRYYPYYRFDGFTNTPQTQQWKLVTLENKYVKVLVAPEIGGKVLGAIDKSTGEEFIYFNKVVKFRDIAMRGAWTSGGIEFNFGSIGHAPTTASPVNYLLKENEDGSVSCFVGAPDITSRTEWRVEIRLAPDKSYFETNAIWYNPSDQNTSLYNWMTASVDASEDLEYYFPGNVEIGHGGEVTPWPVSDKGIDISKYKNNNFGGPKSYHVLGEYAEHFLCYFRDKDFGLGHWSPYDEKPGQKIWMWALSREGAIWTDLLTDPGNIQYSEIQTGLLFNQAAAKSAETPYKHLFFEAGAEHQFTELWFPVKQIGGMVKANEYGSLNVEQKSGAVKIGFCANQAVSEELVVLGDGKEIGRKKIDLQPTEATILSFETGAANIEVKIGGLMSYSTQEGMERVLSKPVKIADEFDWNTPDAIYTAAVEMEKQRDYKGAENKYREVLLQNPFHTGALVKMAGLQYRKMDYEAATNYALKALSNDTYHAEANYIFGLTSLKLNQKYDALDAFSLAARSMEYRSVAYTHLAAIFFKDGEINKSLRYANEALVYNRNNINALELKALCLNEKGEQAKRNAVLDDILTIDPFSAFALFEKGAGLEKALNYEMPQEICLEQAIAYANLGLNDKAIRILQKVEPNAVGNYWLAWLSGDAGFLDRAIEASPYLVYPFRSETAEVLKWALTQQESWKTQYYLGLIEWFKGNETSARQRFIECGNQPDYFAFYLTRFNLLNSDSAYKGEQDLLKAWELNKEEWRCYLALSNYYESQQQFEKALDWAADGAKKFPDSYVLAFQKAKDLLINGAYEKSLDVLAKTTILPNEGASAGRITYRQACIMDALKLMESKINKRALSRLEQAREWPENLGVGKPYDTDERIEDFLESIYWTESGDKNKASELEAKVIDYSLNASKFSPSHYLGALLLKKQGKDQEAASFLQTWSTKESDNKLIAWSYAMLNDQSTEAERILQEIVQERGGTLFNPRSKNPEFGLIVAISEMKGL
ncbi:DUF5107 domain-containing protein [Sunxiuqinia elliptica]|uniref:Uncharacterized protein DUF5107 n=1 Tax=Sunxiuqinia elliptica TaxID=655355 RepID=A0A4R6GL36_9BACT|nr:DUF5107 domain-containing protein [Sunxiuqinia elliptica]TDN95851.1 uncharacterized protein DUF5107 [Sunxiuqinia elliptica]TDO67792.1 uncharacterized protein DUF5107 [Sunxiuqinia elliptica]